MALNFISFKGECLRVNFMASDEKDNPSGIFIPLPPE